MKLSTTHDSGAALALRDAKELADFVVVLEVDADAAAVVAIQRFDHDRIADSPAGAHGVVDVAHERGLRGTGMPTSCRSRLVSSLLPAISTEMFDVSEVTVAQTRF